MKLNVIIATFNRSAVLRRNARLRAGSLPTASEAVHQVMTCYDAVATRPRHLPRPPA